MSLEEDISALQQIDLLSGFSRDHLRLIAFGSHKLAFSKGYEVFHEGQKSDGGYLLLKGSVEIFTRKDEEQISRGKLTPGAVLGPMALISKVDRNYTAIVIEACELFKISQTTMHRVLSEYPELAVQLHQKISGQMTDFINQLEPIQRKLMKH